jgi:hypothetical protein
MGVAESPKGLAVCGLSPERFEEELMALFTTIEVSRNQKDLVRSPNCVFLCQWIEGIVN